MDKGINVFSAFDGSSGGMMALDDVGIKVKDYFASEIDKYAEKASYVNYPNIIRLGDITKIDYSQLPEIDLMLGGFPCTNLSFSGKMKGMVTKDNVKILSLESYITLKEQGFEFEGQSYLFWEFVRLLKLIKPKYFLLENVVMAKEWELTISETLEVKPILINSSLLSAQVRKRLYWTNIPNIQQPEDLGIQLKDILEVDTLINSGAIRGRQLNKATIIGRRLNERGVRDDYNKDVPITQCLEVRATNTDKSNCLTTVEKDNIITNIEIGRHPDIYNKSKRITNVNPSGRGMNGWVYDPDFKSPIITTNKGEGSKIFDDNSPKKFRTLTPTECGRLQTIPDHLLMNIINSGISNSQLYKIFGNGWTIKVISHIFKNLKQELENGK